MNFDATLITAHSDKEHAADNYKSSFGFHRPLLAAGNSNADGQFDYTVGAEQALQQASASGKIVSITNDWATVFPQPDEQSARPREQYGCRNGTSCECAS